MAHLQTTWTAVIIMDFNLRTVHNFSKLSLEIIQLYLVKKKYSVPIDVYLLLLRI